MTSNGTVETHSSVLIDDSRECVESLEAELPGTRSRNARLVEALAEAREQITALTTGQYL
jgi:hypothetical protein